jgi:cellulose biosynthesis protein BcsQ
MFLAPERAEENLMTVVLSIIGRKGGIGKTTLAKNICAAAALAGYSTILIDADGQGNASDGVRVKRFDGFRSLILDNAEWSDLLRPVPTEFTGREVTSFYALPAADRQWEVDQNSGVPPIIVERMSELRGTVDIVVCDLPPGVGNTHIGLYYASDYVLLPTLCEYESVQSLASTVTYLTNAAHAGQSVGYSVAQVLGIVPNRFTVTERVHQANAGYVRGKYDSQFNIFTPLRDLAVWRKAAQLRTSVFALSETGVYAERVEARKAISELAPITNTLFELAKADVQ